MRNYCHYVTEISCFILEYSRFKAMKNINLKLNLGSSFKWRWHGSDKVLKSFTEWSHNIHSGSETISLNPSVILIDCGENNPPPPGLWGFTLWVKILSVISKLNNAGGGKGMLAMKRELSLGCLCIVTILFLTKWMRNIS